MTDFHFVRHGPTHVARAVGWTDVPADLTNEIKLSRVATALPGGATVLSSDLVRARDTASALGLIPTLDSRLREFNYGAWENQTFDAIAATDPEVSRQFWENPGTVRPPGGESWDDLSARVGTVLDAAKGNSSVIVVAHMGVILAALSQASGMAPAVALKFKIAPLSVTRLTWIEAAQTWSVGAVNHEY